MTSINYKAKLLKLSYLKEECNNHSDLFSECVRQFLIDCPEYSKHMTDLEDSLESKDNEDSQKKETKHKDSKKLYRRISKVTHPDKIASPYLEKIFIQSSEDYQNNNIGGLFNTAVQLDVDTTDIDLEQVLEKLELEITKYEQTIENFESSIPWKWFHAETDAEKDYIKKQVDIFFGDKE